MATKPHLPINPIKEEATQRAFKQVQSWLQQLFETISNQASATYGVFTALVNGLVPAPGSTLGKFLRDDATWQTITPGESNTSSNAGAGAGLAKAKVGVDLPFKSLVAGSNVTITPATDTVTIASAAPGETNTGSNVGGGAEVFKTKTGVDFVHRTLVAGTDVTVTQGTNTITIASTVDLTPIGVTLLSTGSDGALVFDGSSTVLGIVPGSNVNFPSYGTNVYSLTRDIYPTTIQIDAGVLVHTNGFRIMGTGHATVNGDVGSPGGAGANATSGAGGAGGAGTSAQVLAGRNAGGNGGSAAGGNSAQAPRDFLSGVNTGGASPGATAGQNGSGLGRGGGGGGSNGGVTSGFSGGTVTNAAAAEGSIDNLIQAISARQITTPSNRYTPGTGGGGGANGGGVKFGGGGGGSGGVVVFTAKSFSGSGTVRAQGGAGGLGNGGGGSGGGGAGGIIVLVNCTGGYPTTDVSGGAGGAATSSGGAGGNGGAGIVKQFKVGA